MGRMEGMKTDVIKEVCVGHRAPYALVSQSSIPEKGEQESVGVIGPWTSSMPAW